MIRTKQITVIGDASGEKEALNFAEKIGAEIARLGFAVITGGRYGSRQ